MLKSLKKIFSKKEPSHIEVKTSELKDYLVKEVSALNLNQSIQEYFIAVEKNKTELLQKIPLLKEEVISKKDQQQVEAKIKNIVLGHRDNYAREAQRFAENLIIIKKKFLTLEDYQEFLRYNQNLDQQLHLLAQRTAKSYPAAQHLFFKPVEEIFKTLGELNLLVKNLRFPEQKLQELEQGRQLLQQLTIEQEKKNDLKEQLKKKETESTQLSKEHFLQQQKLEKLTDCSDYKSYLELKKRQKEIKEQLSSTNDEVYFFFSKIDKALKKYERIAEDTSLIKKYLENCITAFETDSELRINSLLLTLKTALEENKLSLEEKQNNKFIDLIRRSQPDYLQELKEKICKLTTEQENLSKKISENKTASHILEKEKQVDSLQEKIDYTNKEMIELKEKMEKITLQQIKKELEEKLHLKIKD